MTKYWKLIRAFLLVAWRIVFAYFAWILPYSRHPERYPLEVRYAKGRKLVVHVLRAMRLDVEVRGDFQVDKPTLYVANHIGIIDPLLLIAISPRPVSFVAKVEARKLPLAGRFIKAIDGIFLDRKDAFQAVKAFRQAKTNMETTGISYGIFPEGTRRKDPYTARTGEFHAGSFKIAQMAQCPVLVYAGFGSFHFSDERKGHSFPVRLEALYRIEYDALKAKATTLLAEEAQIAIEERLPEMISEDERYFAQGFNRFRPHRWWASLPRSYDQPCVK